MHDARRTTTDDGQRPVTIAHPEHFVLRWAKKENTHPPATEEMFLCPVTWMILWGGTPALDNVVIQVFLTEWLVNLLLLIPDFSAAAVFISLLREQAPIGRGKYLIKGLYKYLF